MSPQLLGLPGDQLTCRHTTHIETIGNGSAGILDGEQTKCLLKA